MIILDDEKVILELSEHDASQLLGLIRKEMSQTDETLKFYWEQQRQNILQSIDRASFNYFQRSISFEDMLRDY